MRRVLAGVAALMLTLGGCSDEDRPPPPRPQFRPLPETNGPQEATEPNHFRRPAPDLRERPEGQAHVMPIRITETRELPAMEEAPARDLSAELRAALGDPNRCIPAGARDLPSSATFSVTAYVSVTGLVTRASASAPGFPPEVGRCLTNAAEHAHLRGPIEGAPRAVQTTLTIRAAAPSMTTATP